LRGCNHNLGRQKAESREPWLSDSRSGRRCSCACVKRRRSITNIFPILGNFPGYLFAPLVLLDQMRQQACDCEAPNKFAVHSILGGFTFAGEVESWNLPKEPDTAVATALTWAESVLRQHRDG
jgi:hypothetical protein